MTQSFHSRLLIVIVGLVLLAQLGTTAAMFVAARRTAYELADQRLSVSERLLQDVLAARDSDYRTSLQALAGDFAFREAVSSHDSATIKSALANHGARVAADLVVLLDNAGQVVASTDSSLEASPPLALAQLLGSAHDTSGTPAVADFKGKLLQLVVVPVRAPDTVGWVGMGFVLRDYVVERIKAVGGADVTFVALNRGAPPSIAASTIPEDQRATLEAQVRALINDDSTTRVISTQGQDYLTKAVAVPATNGREFFAILQLPASTVSGPLVALRYQLLEWAGAVTALCIAVGVWSARSLSQPIRALAVAARSLQPTRRARDRKSEAAEDEVSSLAGAFQALAHRTQYDSLTGLPNRSLLAEWLTASISRAEREHMPLAVVFVDLDGFKGINESLGRAMGDLVLRKTAQRLLRCMRSCDIVARVGSDEFVLVLEGVSQAVALRLIDRLVSVVAKPMKSPNGSIAVTMRAGIAMFPDHARDRDGLLLLADSAKYESKNRKQATVVAKRPPGLTAGATATASTTRALTGHDTWSGAPWEGDDLATQPMRTIDSDTP